MLYKQKKTNHVYSLYMHKENSALNDLQWLICHKSKPNHVYSIYKHTEDSALNNLQWLLCHKSKPNQIMYTQYICIKRIRLKITYHG